MEILLILLYVWLGLGLLITVLALTAINYDFERATFDGKIKEMWAEGIKEASLKLSTTKLECHWWLFIILVLITPAGLLFGKSKD